jgi:hypothetical protein
MNSFARAVLSLFPLLALFALTAFLPQTGYAQDLPKEIRGYKVHDEKVVVSTREANQGSAGVVVAPSDPKLIDLSVTGVTFELTPQIHAMPQSGTVYFITFNDFRVNGIPVEVEEYTESFPFRRNEPLTLPKPARVFMPTHRILQAAWKEMKESKKEWTVTGRVFVFGKFRKFGFSFKRVVPVDISVTIRNPIS